MSKETLLPHRSFSTVLVVLVLLLGTLMAPVPYSSGEDSRAERTLYVDDDGTETYTSIQSAVNAASAGDTIVVRDGEYVENLVIGREITLRSDNGSAFTTIRAASSSNHCVQLLGDRTVLQGFTITGAADGYNSANVYINKASHCEILENDIRDSYHGA